MPVINGTTLLFGVIVVKEARVQLRQTIPNGDGTTRIPGVIAVKGARANLHRAYRYTKNGATISSFDPSGDSPAQQHQDTAPMQQNGFCAQQNATRAHGKCGGLLAPDCDAA